MESEAKSIYSKGLRYNCDFYLTSRMNAAEDGSPSEPGRNAAATERDDTDEINPALNKKGLSRDERVRHTTSLRGAKEIKQFLMLLFLSHLHIRNGTLLADIKVAVSLLIDDSGCRYGML